MRRRGFTLAEVMVAMLFLSIAMFGYIGLHMRILHSSGTLQERHSVRRKVDLHGGLVVALMRRGKDISDGVYPLFLDSVIKEFLTPYLEPPKDMPGESYDGRIEVQSQANPPDLRHVTVYLQWTNRHGPQEYVADTFLGRKDPGW